MGGARGRVKSFMGAFARRRPQWQVERMAVVHGVSWWYAQELWRFLARLTLATSPSLTPVFQTAADVTHPWSRIRILAACHLDTLHTRAITDLTSLIIPIRAWYRH